MSAATDPLGLHSRRPGRPGLPGGSRRVTFVLDESGYQLLEEAAKGRPVSEVVREIVIARLKR